MLDQAHLVRDAALLAVAHGGGEAGLGHTDHDVRLNGVLAAEAPARFLAVQMDVAAVDIAVGTGVVDVFHRAHAVLLEARIAVRAQAMGVERDHLARLHVPQEAGAHDAEGAGLAADHIAVAQRADDQGLDAVLVPAGVDAVLGHHQDGEAAFDHVERLEDVDDTVLAIVLLDQMGEELAVRRGLEDDAALLEQGLDLLGIDDVAVTGDGEIPLRLMEEDGVHVVQSALADIGVLDTADADGAVQVQDIAVREDLAQQAQAAVAAGLALLVEGHDAGAFLAPVLDVVQAVIKIGGGVLDAIYSEYAHISSLPKPWSICHTHPGRRRRRR